MQTDDRPAPRRPIDLTHRTGGPRALTTEQGRELEQRERNRAFAMSRRREYNPNSDKPVCQGGPRWYV